MNYVVSVYANRVSGVNAVELYSGGVVIKSYYGRFAGDNIKENVLTCITKGLRLASTSVKHEDRLYVEVQNQHIVGWLMGRVEYKEYNTFIDEVFKVLEGIDCQYKFLFEKSPKAKSSTVNDNKVPKFTASVGIESMISELEG